MGWTKEAKAKAKERLAQCMTDPEFRRRFEEGRLLGRIAACNSPNRRRGKRKKQNLKGQARIKGGGLEIWICGKCYFFSNIREGEAWLKLFRGVPRRIQDEMIETQLALKRLRKHMAKVRRVSKEIIRDVTERSNRMGGEKHQEVRPTT